MIKFVFHISVERKFIASFLHTIVESKYYKIKTDFSFLNEIYHLMIIALLLMKNKYRLDDLWVL